MVNPNEPSFLDAADPASFRQAMAASLEELERLVEEAVQPVSNDSPELRRLVGYCEAMLHRLASRPRHSPEDVTLDSGTLAAVRYVVLAGLQSFGEVERLTNAWSVFQDSAPAAMRPRDAIGDAEMVSKFAEALVYLEPAMVRHD